MRTPLVSSLVSSAVSSIGRHRVLVIALAGAVVASVLAVACSTTNDEGSAQIIACREVFTGCPLDPMPSLADTQSCTASLDGPCGNAGLIYRTCVTGACTDAGFTDYAGISARCYNDQLAFQECLDSLDAGTTDNGGDDLGDDDQADAGSVGTTPTATATSTGTTAPPTPTVDAASPIDASEPVDATSATDGGDSGKL